MTAAHKARALDILLVEDNDADARLAREALREVDERATLHAVDHGEEALAFLRQQGRFAGAARPDLILLDLNLPRVDGREVLAEIKRDPALRRIPVLVLTTSRAEEDVFRCYDLHANCCIAKPVDLDEFVRILRSVDDFWLRVAKLPVH